MMVTITLHKDVIIMAECQESFDIVGGIRIGFYRHFWQSRLLYNLKCAEIVI